MIHMLDRPGGVEAPVPGLAGRLDPDNLQSRPGNRFFTLRRIELILVELLRSEPVRADRNQAGFVAGPADAMIARALSALHGDVPRDRTVASPARLCGASRSKFAPRFQGTIEVRPIDYLIRWRDDLSRSSRRMALQGPSDTDISRA